MNSITIEVVRNLNESWGIVVAGEGTCCFIDHVELGSPAYDAGLQKGDFLLGVNGVDVSEASHDYVALLVRESGRIVRLKIIPSPNSSNHSPAQYEEPFWTNEDPLTLLKPTNSSLAGDGIYSTEDDEATMFNFTANFEKYCQMFEHAKAPEQESEKSKLQEDRIKRKVNRFPTKTKDEEAVDDSKSIEQSQFVVTREHQRDFDENYVPECTFQGQKASVAGAFTGDHNQIIGDDHDDVRGIRARVEAGIQHFSFGHEQDKIKPEDRGKIILYTTSLRINRAISQRCDQVRSIFKGFRVKYEDRDIYNSPEHKDELYERLGLQAGNPFPDLPRVYLDGVYVGAKGDKLHKLSNKQQKNNQRMNVACSKNVLVMMILSQKLGKEPGLEEVQAMSDCGDLRIRLKEFSKFNLRSCCPTCDGTGTITCRSCKGQTFRKKNRFAVLKCGDCRQKGTLPCPDCL